MHCLVRVSTSFPPHAGRASGPTPSVQLTALAPSPFRASTRQRAPGITTYQKQHLEDIRTQHGSRVDEAPLSMRG